MRKSPPALLLLALTTLNGSVAVAETKNAAAHRDVEAETILQVPSQDYRKNWVQLGTFAVHGDAPQEGAKEMHVVYVERKNLEAYVKSHEFPDGTVLVKDVFKTKTETLTTGTVSYAGELAGRFVMVRDKTNSKAPSSPRFGEGWGWAFYEGQEKRRTLTTDFKTDCLVCHEPARETNLIYTRGYPLLQQ